MSETPSERANRVIGLCAAGARGAGDPRQLHQVLSEYHSDLSAARAQFRSEVGVRPELHEPLASEIARVLEAFDAYGRAIEEAGGYFSDRDLTRLARAAEVLPGHYKRLCDAMWAYEDAYLSHGSRAHPSANLMEKASRALESGDLDEDGYADLLDHLWQHFTRGMKTFEEDEDPHRALRGVQACRDALGGVQELEGFLDGRHPAQLEKGIARLDAAGAAIGELMGSEVSHVLAGGPTPSPVVNWVLHAARGVVEWGVPPGVLAEAVDWFEGRLSEAYLRFESGATSALEGPGRMAEEIPRARRGFDDLQQAAVLLRRVPEDPRTLGAALTLLERGAATLHRSHRVLESVSEGEDQVACLRCGAASPSQARVCEACGAALPRLLPKVEAASGIETTHVQKLVGACQDVEEGTISSEEFAAVLEWGLAKVRAARQGIARLPAPESLDAESREALSALEAGLDEFGAALVEMGGYLGDRGASHLHVGKGRLRGAAELLARVQAMGASPPPTAG